MAKIRYQRNRHINAIGWVITRCQDAIVSLVGKRLTTDDKDDAYREVELAKWALEDLLKEMDRQMEEK